LPDIIRDDYGRPLVIPPGGGPREPYRRTTTFIAALEDTAGLRRWEMRQLAVGLARRPDLVLAAAAVDPQAARAGRRGINPDREKLDEIVAKATEPASAAATTGTSLHSLTERLDRGQRLGYVPDPYGADVQAYAKGTAGIEWRDIETFRVLDGWKVAGTADRIGWYRRQLVVADVKTGSIDYPHKFAMQLAIYARSLSYDVETDTRGPADLGLDLRRGLIIHLPAGQGRCDLYEIDIEKGWEACLLAKKVRDWRATKNLLRSAENTDGAPDLTEAARTAPNIETLREVWRTTMAHNGLTTDFLDAVEKRRAELGAAEHHTQRR
jgi:hypothetical protein